ncbi:MAG TPA: bacteriohemerythrin [Terriglobales bacterium]|nr:bacteriohemerythrin [Terriglobales bacterium]
MALVTWDQSYSVKVKQCDEEHQKLFHLMNALHEAMRVGRGRTVLQQIVAELGDYTNTHFRAEEALMEQCRYPSLAGHRLEHQKFVARVSEFQKDLKAGTGGNSVAVLEFLKDWLVKHIKKVDQSYSAHLNAHGIS